MKDLRCMSFLSKDASDILVAGCQKTMFKIDVERGCVVQEVLEQVFSYWSRTDPCFPRLLQETSIPS